MNMRLKELQETLRADPLQIEARMEYVSLLFERCQFEEAIDTLKQAVELPVSAVQRAFLLTSLGWYTRYIRGVTEEPRRLAEQALGLTRDTNTPLGKIVAGKALALIAECAWVEEPALARSAASSAAVIFDSALAQNELPDSVDPTEALLDSARLNFLLGRMDAAIQRSKEALQAAYNTSQELDSLFELGTMYRHAGRLTDARDALTKAIQFHDVAPFRLVYPYYELCLTEEALGKTPEARAKIRRAIGILQDYPVFPRHELADLLCVQGSLSYELNDLEDASTCFAAALEAYPTTDPQHWNCVMWLATCQYTLGRLEAARKNATLVLRSGIAPVEDCAGAEQLLRYISDSNAGDSIS